MSALCSVVSGPTGPDWFNSPEGGDNNTTASTATKASPAVSFTVRLTPVLVVVFLFVSLSADTNCSDGGEDDPDPLLHGGEDPLLAEDLSDLYSQYDQFNPFDL